MRPVVRKNYNYVLTAVPGRRAVQIALILFSGCLAGIDTQAKDEAPEGSLQLSDYWNYEEAENAQISPDGERIIYTRKYISKLDDKWVSELWSVDPDGSDHWYFGEGSNVTWSPDGSDVAYIGKAEDDRKQVFVRRVAANSVTRQVTRTLNPPKDIKWSPDGNYIAFRAFVPRPSQLDIGMPSPPKGAHWTKEPMVTDRLHYKQDRVGYLPEGFTHLFMVPADGGKPRQVTHGDWNVGVGDAAGFDWTPDGRYIVFAGEMDDIDLLYLQSSINVVNTETGEARNLTPGRAFWTNPTVSPDGEKIAYTGRPDLEDAWAPGEIWVMNLDGSDKQQVTRNSPDTPRDVRWSRNGKELLFEYRASGDQNLYRVSLNGKFEPVTQGEHVLNVTSTSDNGIVAGILTSPRSPKDVVTFDLNSPRDIRQVTELNEDILTGITLSDYEEVLYQSSDGTEVQSWIVKPYQFEPSKQYPLILVIHGGPHSMYDVSFRYDWQNYAANGYIVLFANQRGSTGYGGEFGNSIANTYPGRRSFDDLTNAVEAIEDRGYVDATREYVTGCSAGGVLSTWLIAHTNRFAAAAPLCAAVDWIVVMGMSDAPAFVLSAFFDTPWWEDSTEWLEHSPLMHVGKVQTPTMLVTGAEDMRIPFGQAEAYYAALKLRGVPARLIRMVDEAHGVTSRPTNFLRVQLYTLDWWRRWSK